MSDAQPKPRPTPKSATPKTSSPALVSHRASRGKVKVMDLLLFAFGGALCAAIGYVGYRTQVLGEPVDKVLPFLAVHHDKSPVPGAASPGAKTEDKNPGQKKQPAGDKPADGSQEPNPDDTLFGRRIR